MRKAEPIPRVAGSTGPAVRVRLLGAFEVEVDGRVVPGSAWRLRKAGELVRILSLAPGHRVHREALMEQLWPDRPIEAASNNLNQAVRVARSALGPSDEAGRRALVQRDGTLSFCPAGDLWVDAAAFAAAVREAGDGGDDLDGLLAARALYRGEPLPDDRYADWAAGTREALSQDHLSLLARIAELEERDGRMDAAIDVLRELLELEPTDESAHRSLMRLYAVGDRRQLALRQFERLRTILARELEVEPADASRQLYRDILEGRVVPNDGAAAARGAASDDAGDRTGSAPADRIVRRRAARPRSHNLPVQLSSFVGREREVRQIDRLLQGARALTLIGSGGTGKTRLAIEAAAAHIAAERDGVWLVELAAVNEPALVIQAIADVFDIREWQAESYIELVVEHLADRQILLVLDNCEHLIDACATVAQTLLRACSELRILATSRQPLRIPGEVVFRVPSLPVPDPDTVTRDHEVEARNRHLAELARAGQPQTQRAARLRRPTALVLAALSRGTAAAARRLDDCVADDLGRGLAPTE